MKRSAPRSRCAGRRTGSAVAFRLAHEGRRALDAEEADLGPEVVAHVLAAVIVAQPQAGGDVLGERAEALAHRLLHRLESLEAVRVEGSVMPTHSAEQWSTATNT